MYAIASGQCSVLVDPSFRPEAGGLAEADPKKAMQVGAIGRRSVVEPPTPLPLGRINGLPGTCAELVPLARCLPYP
jgi:hypothetical protein